MRRFEIHTSQVQSEGEESEVIVLRGTREKEWAIDFLKDGYGYTVWQANAGKPIGNAQK
jgi:hypothetical protein